MTAYPTDKPSCRVCGSTFDSAEELAIHQRETSHTTTEEAGFRCLECDERIEDPEKFREHLRLVHTRNV